MSINYYFTEKTQVELLNKFYIENCENGLLSKEDIKKICKNNIIKKNEESDYKCIPYDSCIINSDLVEKIIFGFKNGLFFTSTEIYEIGTTYEKTLGVFFGLSVKYKEKIKFQLKYRSPLELIRFYNFHKMEFIKEQDLDKKFFWYLQNEKNEYFSNRRYLMDEIVLIESLIKVFNDKVTSIIDSNNRIIEEEERKRITLLNLNKLEIINELDKDGDKEVDLVDGESFNKLLTKNQKSIVEIDKNYIQKFVKISMYLKTKRSNTQKIFDSIKDTKNDTELNELVNLLKNQIHTYELLVFHSISMITSLVDSDLISFYEIYECFDQLGVFNSNWENDVSGKLSNIGEGIKDLMYSIYHMEQSIVNSLDNLSYITQDSFRELNISVNNQLSSIDSSIKFNNLLTGIQTYQMYKINQNTKRLG